MATTDNKQDDKLFVEDLEKLDVTTICQKMKKEAERWAKDENSVHIADSDGFTKLADCILKAHEREMDTMANTLLEAVVLARKTRPSTK